MLPLTFSLQALLTRHEAYIADSERERKAMAAHIERLEMDKQTLEQQNAAAIEESRNLLDQLEALNNETIDSDAQVTSLQATLLSTQQELQKLSHLSARTARLEQELSNYEQQELHWQNSLESKHESEKAATRRWQQAERTLATLQEQMELIEQESKEEKERHAEVVSRMERRHVVESELNSAAGRLKGAAATKTAGRDGGGPNVVSHFVKDILQDNANLQMGIVELRELLQMSNDEVEALRTRMLDHQPTDDHETPTRDATKHRDLKEEMGRAASQELHVHHHYHAPPSQSKPTPPRRTKKKRYGSLASSYASDYSVPRSSVSLGTSSSMATILQQTAVSVPRPIPDRKRWSALSSLSSQTYHSMPATSGPSSPQSTTNRMAMYDRVFSDAGQESSRPTSPETEDPGSPMLAPTHIKRGSLGSFRTRSAPGVRRGGINPGTDRFALDSILDTSVEQLPELERPTSATHVIPEELEEAWDVASSADEFTLPMGDELISPLGGVDIYKRTLRRAASHESLLSISGMDIHTLQSRPSQLLTPYSRSFLGQASISDAQAYAVGSATFSRPANSSHSLLSGMAVDRRQTIRPSLSKKASGWMFGRWGASPSPSVVVDDAVVKGNTVRTPSIASSSTVSTDRAVAALDTTPKPKMRMPGINQAGPIPGFRSEIRLQFPPVIRNLDEEALRNALG